MIKKIAAGLLVVAGLSACGQISAVSTTPVAAASKPAPEKSSAQQHADTLKTCVEQISYVNSAHVVNGFIATVDLYTSLAGGFASSDSGRANLMVQSVQSCASTKDGAGLVTVYGSDGEMITLGNF